MGFTTCFDRQAGEVSKFSAYGMFSDFLFQTTTYAVRGEAYGSSKMTTYNVRGEASKGLRDSAEMASRLSRLSRLSSLHPLRQLHRVVARQRVGVAEEPASHVGVSPNDLPRP